jgi:alpha-tubulin suppressor-like RCC1 family protein/uncharacterized protein YjdB
MRRFSIIASLVLTVAACGSNDSSTPPATVTSVILNQAAAMLTPGQRVTLVATPRDAQGNALTGQAVTWASDAPAVATVSGGTVTAVAVGTATVTATSGSHSASATITVAATVVPVASVVLNASSAGLVSGQQATFTATAKDAAGNTLTGRGVTWMSSATSVATVDGNGTVTGVVTGTATVTATVEGKSASATITVGPGQFVGALGGTATAAGGNASVTIPAGALSSGTAITVAPVTNPQPDPKLAPGTAFDFGPTGTTFSAPVTLNINYDPAVLVAGTNQAQLKVFKLVGTTWTVLAGSTVNTSTHVVTGQTSSFSTYAVLELVTPVATVAITPNPVDLPNGMQVQLATTLKDAQGNVLTGRNVTWNSATQGVATISTAGLVTSVAVGSTVITATSEGVSSQLTLNVRSDPSARTIALDRGSGSIFVSGRGLVVIPGVASPGCAIGSDQHGYCWGSNSLGQVGDGTGVDRAVPTAIALQNPLVAVTVGTGFACALDTGHKVWCWGGGADGEFGNGSVASSNQPVAAASGHQFVDIAAGRSSVCGIDLVGATYCWGRNLGGILGIGNTVELVSTPTRVSNDPGFVSIRSGVYSTCALTATGTPWCWGTVTDDHAITVPSAVTGAPAFSRLAVGSNHVCGIAMDRRLYCWGDNTYGQLGDGSTGSKPGATLVSGGLTWRAIAAGMGHTCGVTTDSRTFCWGDNYDGDLGIGSIAMATTPTQVMGGIPPMATVAAGASTSCGLTVIGAGYCWGSRGALGDGDYGYTTTPTQVVGISGATDIFRGSSAACAITASKQPSCWGESEDENSASPPSFGTAAVRGISFGSDFFCLIADGNGRISCEGGNASGQLGNGTTANTSTTQLSPINSALSFTAVATGSQGGCGISSAKGLYCWGGSLFIGPTPVLSPVAIMPALSFVTVAGDVYSGVCGVTDAGSAYCGTFPPTFAQVGLGLHWVSMDPAGNNVGGTAGYMCGLTDSGDAYCSGENSAGQLGDGTTTTRASMTLVSGGLHFTQVVTGGNTTCGIATGGLAYCWGDGTGGQLGSAPGQLSNVPVAVPGGLHFSKLSIGNGLSGTEVCGINTAGLVYCWGPEAYSALGNGMFDDERLPVAMQGSVRFLLYEPGTVNLRR